MFEEVDLGPSMMRLRDTARRNFLETLKNLIEDGVISENDRVGDVVYNLEKGWNLEEN